MTRRPESDHGGPAFGSTETLKRFLAKRGLPAGTLGYRELQGFLFTVAAVPDLVPPSEWIPLVFGDSEPAFDDKEQAREVLGGLLQLYNEINADVFERGGRLPRNCRFREDPLANLAEDAPVSQWSRGFSHGHLWLREAWDGLPAEQSDDLAYMLLVLSFFSSRKLAESCLEECARPEMTLPEMAENMRAAFPHALGWYASVGRSLHRARLERLAPRTTPRVGRNDPCPCGSGRKYKRCCGASV